MILFTRLELPIGICISCRLFSFLWSSSISILYIVLKDHWMEFNLRFLYWYWKIRSSRKLIYLWCEQLTFIRLNLSNTTWWFFPCFFIISYLRWKKCTLWLLFAYWVTLWNALLCLRSWGNLMLVYTRLLIILLRSIDIFIDL